MRNLIDFGQQIRVPNMDYWQYFVQYFNENNLIFHLTKTTNCLVIAEVLDGSVRYDLNNLTQDEIDYILSILSTSSVIRSYDKTYIVKHEQISESCLSMILIDYDRI